MGNFDFYSERILGSCSKDIWLPLPEPISNRNMSCPQKWDYFSVLSFCIKYNPLYPLLGNRFFRRSGEKGCAPLQKNQKNRQKACYEQGMPYWRNDRKTNLFLQDPKYLGFQEMMILLFGEELFEFLDSLLKPLSVRMFERESLFIHFQWLSVHLFLEIYIP